MKSLYQYIKEQEENDCGSNQNSTNEKYIRGSEEDIQFLINGNPICDIKDDNFTPKENTTFIDQVDDYFENSGRTVQSKFGEVTITRSGIKSDRRHGMGIDKRNSITAIKDVISKGVVILPMGQYHVHGKDKIETGMIAAPITIKNQRYISVVELSKSRTHIDLKVHEVTPISKTENLRKTVVPNRVHNKQQPTSLQSYKGVANVLNYFLNLED